jgi:glycerol-3-phosphate dehydrogenase
MKRAIAALTEEMFDVVIVGGGITGAGVALDATLRGWRVALIDKGDFASGTSSVSSKLIHGGLRYLEQGNFPLVYEALRERGRLLRNAPHLVRPLRFFLPFYQSSRVPGWKWRLGLTLYDLLAGRRNIRRSRPLSLSTLARQCPLLRRSGLVGGAEFYDAQMDDARLCLEVLNTADAYGARIANYVEAIGFEKQAGELTGVRVRDRLTGQELTVRARQILNATGPWVDSICQLAGEQARPHLQPTKGVHLVVPSQDLPAGFLLLHPADGRVFFVLPWLGKTLIGTTDTFSPVGPDSLSVELEDMVYLLAGYNHYFQVGVRPEQVLGSFAGLRPLLQAKEDNPSSLSREFRLWRGSSGLLSVAGGKYTTYRHMAQVLTDALGRLLGKKQRCRTQDYPLLGTPAEPWETAFSRLVTTLCHRFALDPASARHLVQRYGQQAEKVVRYIIGSPDGREPLVPGEPDLRGEIRYQQEHEMALFPADHFLRRMRLGLFHPEILHSLKEPRTP